MQRLIQVCGCNGSGKSTFARLLSLKEQLLVVDPDQLARDGLTPIQAGKYAAMLSRSLLEQGVSFIRESTLTSKFDFRLMIDAKKRGYELELIYISLPSVELAIRRVGERIKRGGHGVPEPDIIRRYNRSLLNLPAAKELVDKFTMLDNSSTGFIQIR